MNRRQRQAKERGARKRVPGAEAIEPKAALDAAIAHHRAGRLSQAEPIYRRVLEAQPENAEALHWLGLIALQTGRYEVAIDLIGKAIASDPQQALFHLNLGYGLLQQGQPEAAISSFRRATGIDTNLLEAHNILGIALHEIGRHEEAVAAFRRAIALDPGSDIAHNNLGATLREQGRLEEAVACLGRAIEINPRHAEAHNNLGVTQDLRGRRDQALACYRRALEIDPDYVEARYNHATLHQHVPGDPAIDELNRLLARDDLKEEERNQLYFALGKAHDDIGGYAEAFAHYRRANEDRANRVRFDRSEHRRGIGEIKTAFREPHQSMGGDSGPPDRVPIFVVGVSRSGKSLVESLLARHEDVYGAGERRQWSGAVAKVLERYSIPQSFPGFMTSLDEDKISEIGETYIEDISRLSPDSRFLVDTLPGNFRYVGLILRAIPFARIVYCHRDPLDNCLFAYFTRHRTSSYSFDFENLASYYADYHGMMAHWQGLYGDRIQSVAYEELVRNPTETGARIYRYCGIEYGPAVLGGTFTTHEIGHWRHYEPYLGPLRQALGRLAR